MIYLLLYLQLLVLWFFFLILTGFLLTSWVYSRSRFSSLLITNLIFCSLISLNLSLRLLLRYRGNLVSSNLLLWLNLLLLLSLFLNNWGRFKNFKILYTRWIGRIDCTLFSILVITWLWRCLLCCFLIFLLWLLLLLVFYLTCMFLISTMTPKIDSRDSPSTWLIICSTS